MAVVILPDWAVPSITKPGIVSNGFLSNPVFGGPLEFTERPGDRFSFTATFPAYRSDGRGENARGAEIVADLIKAKSQGLRLKWPQNGFKPMVTGSPVTSGAAQSGTFLNLSGGQPYAVIKKGQFFHIARGEERYLHVVQETVSIPASGSFTVEIEPPLRIVANAGLTCNFHAPEIQGFPLGDVWEWTTEIGGIVSPISFKILEMD